MSVQLVADCGSRHAGEPMRVIGDAGSTQYCLDKTTLVDQNDIVSGEMKPNPHYRPYILLTLTPEAGQRFREVTGKNVNNRVGIVVNGRLVEIAILQAPVDQVYLSGSLTHAEIDSLTR
jgi:preprotein translocase subunit SecD